MLALYPLLTALSRGNRSVIGGFGPWRCGVGHLGGALANRLLERIPPDDRPPYLALYNLALNGAMLLGSLGWYSHCRCHRRCEALLMATGLRLVAALLLWRFRMRMVTGGGWRRGRRMKDECLVGPFPGPNRFRREQPKRRGQHSTYTNCLAKRRV